LIFASISWDGDSSFCAESFFMVCYRTFAFVSSRFDGIAVLDLGRACAIVRLPKARS
jgi:hypothetical protein